MLSALARSLPPDIGTTMDHLRPTAGLVLSRAKQHAISIVLSRACLGIHPGILHDVACRETGQTGSMQHACFQSHACPTPYIQSSRSSVSPGIVNDVVCMDGTGRDAGFTYRHGRRHDRRRLKDYIQKPDSNILSTSPGVLNDVASMDGQRGQAEDGHSCPIHCKVHNRAKGVVCPAHL